MNVQFRKYRYKLYGMTHVLFTVLFCWIVDFFVTGLFSSGNFGDGDGHLPAILTQALFLGPYARSIFILSILSGFFLLFLRLRSRLIFEVYTAFFVLVSVAWALLASMALYVLLFGSIVSLEIQHYELYKHVHKGETTINAQAESESVLPESTWTKKDDSEPKNSEPYE